MLHLVVFLACVHRSRITALDADTFVLVDDTDRLYTCAIHADGSADCWRPTYRFSDGEEE